MYKLLIIMLQYHLACYVFICSKIVLGLFQWCVIKFFE